MPDQATTTLIEAITALQTQIDLEQKSNNASTIHLQQQKDALTTFLRESEHQAYGMKSEFEQISQQLRQQHIRDKRQYTLELNQLRLAWRKQLPANC